MNYATAYNMWKDMVRLIRLQVLLNNDKKRMMLEKLENIAGSGLLGALS